MAPIDKVLRWFFGKPQSIPRCAMCGGDARGIEPDIFGNRFCCIDKRLVSLLNSMAVEEVYGDVIELPEGYERNGVN